MTTTAFIPACKPLTGAFVGWTRSALSVKRPDAYLRIPFTRKSRRIVNTTIALVQQRSPDDQGIPEGFGDVIQQFSLALLGAHAAMSGANAAMAVPESLVEAFKSKPASLVHPVVMWLALGTALYTFYLGYQSSLVRKSEPEKRKQLIKGKFADRHFQTSSALFAVMTVATFSGMANTYARTDKLFPGPHLYAGLGLVATLSVMSSLAPHMQKGKDWARNTHFTLAFLAVSLFGWQAKSGMVIVGKLLGWDQ